MILPHQRQRAWTWGHLFSKSLSFSHFRWVYFPFLFAIAENCNCLILVNVICRDGAPTDKVRPLSFSTLALVKSISLNEIPLGYLVHWVDSIQKEYIKLCLLLFICYLWSVFFFSLGHTKWNSGCETHDSTRAAWRLVCWADWKWRLIL